MHHTVSSREDIAFFLEVYKIVGMSLEQLLSIYFHIIFLPWFTGFPSSKYVVYATACVHRELYRKITDRKIKLSYNYLI